GLMELFDSGTVVYGGIFLIAFSLLFFSLSKIFKDSAGNPSKATAGTISFAISAMATYGIYWSRWDPTSLLSAGLFNGAVGSIIPLVVIAAIILLIWKLQFANSMITIGLLLISLTFTDFIYEKGSVATIGIILLIAGFFLKNRGARAVAGGIATRRPMWVFTLAGIVALVLGFFLGNGIIILVGIVLAVVGMLGKKVGGKIKETSQNVVAGRVFSKSKAEDEARIENTRRDADALVKRTRMQAKLQHAYNQQKAIYIDKTLPKPTRKSAAKQIQKILGMANQGGFNITP
ncbi:MAG: hypothetical protein ABIJ58_01770, partial [Nanoarchaeota archaeon]